MRLRESPLWLYCSSSLRKNLPSGGGLTWKVSRRPLLAQTLPLLCSGRAGMEQEPRLSPLWPVPAHSSCAGRLEQCGLEVQYNPTEAFFLKWQKKFSSHCPAADCRNDSVADVAVRDDATVGWSELKSVLIYHSSLIVKQRFACWLPNSSCPSGGSTNLWEGRAGPEVCTQK